MIAKHGSLRLVVSGATTLILSLGPAVFSEAQVDVWIDPGHGGTSTTSEPGCGDVGAPGFNGDTPPDERHITLAIAQKVANVLGYTSLLTRNSDHCVMLADRVLMSVGLRANDQLESEPGTIFVSIHADGDANPATFGTTVLSMAPNPKSRRSRKAYRTDSTFAGIMDGPFQSGAAAAYLGCHDARDPRKQDGKHVLKWSRIPSVLVECGFISNQCQFTNIIQQW